MTIWQITIDNGKTSLWMDPDGYPKHMIEEFVYQHHKAKSLKSDTVYKSPKFVVEEHKTKSVQGLLGGDRYFDRRIIEILTEYS